MKLIKTIKGRQYPFDIVGKAFTTLPFQDNQTNHLLTNFDLIYDCSTHRVAGLTRCDSARSDPGVYVCCTDMLFFLASKGEELFHNRIRWLIFKRFHILVKNKLVFVTTVFVYFRLSRMKRRPKRMVFSSWTQVAPMWPTFITNRTTQFCSKFKRKPKEL